MIEQYMATFHAQQHLIVTEMEAYAKEQHVPIMERSGMEMLLGLLRLQQPTSILEIGSAIGYSAIRMALELPNATIHTIERDQERYMKAIDYVERAQLSSRISFHFGDALEIEHPINEKSTFDALFIDAAKGQYKRFFERYAPFIEAGGMIYCDNIFMHGDVFLPEDEIPKRKRTMIRNLKAFTNWLLHHPNYDTSLFPIGDGILVARKHHSNEGGHSV